MTSDLFDLAGRVAIVTGASSGLGKRFASVLVDAGATVVVAARRADRLAAFAATHERLFAVQCDVRNPEDLDGLVDGTFEAHGRLDILVNNAGTSAQAPSESMPLDDFADVIDVNLNALFALSQRASRLMLQAGSGTIVNVASILGLVASSPLNQAGYCASKGAVIALTRQLAVEWADRGVRVNALAPGWFPSELTQELFDDDRGARWLSRNTPMGRAGRESELDGSLLLLASDAGSFITGQILAVDGGWTSR